MVAKFQNHSNNNLAPESTEFYKPFLEMSALSNIAEETKAELRLMAKEAIKNKILITVAIVQKIDFFPIPVLSQLGGPSSKTEASLSKGFQAFISLKGGSRAAKTT